MTKTTNNTELRIVRGNGFAVRVEVEARRLDGTVIEDFSLADAEATLNIIYYDSKTAYEYAVDGNAAVISFSSDLNLGWYGMEMIGTYNSIQWRWCVRNVFQIVETNEKANIPNWTILADDTYIVSGVLTLTEAGSSTQVQADWAQTDTTAKSYIKHKPDLTKYARLDENNTHESGTSDEWTNTTGGYTYTAKILGNTITLARLGEDGRVMQIYPDRIRFRGSDTPNPITGETWEYVLSAAHTQPDWEETDPNSHGYILNKPDLSVFVTNTALATVLAGYVTNATLATVLNGYVTHSNLATALADYVTTSALATALADKLDVITETQFNEIFD